MPIYIKKESDNSKIADLALGIWDLPNQVKELEQWLFENRDNYSPDQYVADIGFSMRENACGGGAVLSPSAMGIMSILGIKLFLSEYPDD